MIVFVAAIAVLLLFVAAVVGVAEAPRVGVVLSLLGGFLVGWITLSANQPWRYQNEQTTLSEVREGRAVVIYNDRVHNLNKMFGRNVPEGTPVTCRQTKPGWYAGIHWPDRSEDFSLILPK